ncbi:MAG: response regulator [Micavibrio sp.]
MAQIVVAEDDDSMRHFLTHALEKAGHEVEACADGIAALRALEARTETDLLLADIVMPGMDGIELARKAQEALPHLKVMFITGFAAVAMAEADDNAPPPEILSKPFHLKDLVNRVEQLLAA